jgi:hypothetical protein
MKKSRRHPGHRKADTFDPQSETLVEHQKLRVWDLYVERDPKLSYFPASWKIEEYAEMFNDLHYLRRTIRDVGTVAWPYCLFSLCPHVSSCVSIPGLRAVSRATPRP